MSIGKLPSRQAPKLEPSTKVFNGYLSKRHELSQKLAIQDALKRRSIKNAVNSMVSPKEIKKDGK